MSTAIDQMFAGSAEGMTNNGYASEMGRMSVVGRINYSYMDKYLLEAILRADASAKFPPEIFSQRLFRLGGFQGKIHV